MGYYDIQVFIRNNSRVAQTMLGCKGNYLLSGDLCQSLNRKNVVSNPHSSYVKYCCSQGFHWSKKERYMFMYVMHLTLATLLISVQPFFLDSLVNLFMSLQTTTHTINRFLFPSLLKKIIKKNILFTFNIHLNFISGIIRMINV